MKKIILFICFVLLMLPLFSEVNPIVIIDTEFGKITVEIYLKAAPITAKNFLKYVRMNAYKDSSFYRTVRMDNQPDNEIRIEVIQAGHNHKLMTEKYGKECGYARLECYGQNRSGRSVSAGPAYC